MGIYPDHPAHPRFDQVYDLDFARQVRLQLYLNPKSRHFSFNIVILACADPADPLSFINTPCPPDLHLLQVENHLFRKCHCEGRRRPPEGFSSTKANSVHYRMYKPNLFPSNRNHYRSKSLLQQFEIGLANPIPRVAATSDFSHFCSNHCRILL